MPGSVGRGVVLGVAVLVCLAGRAAAQAPGIRLPQVPPSTDSFLTTGPGSVGTPALASPSQPPPPPTVLEDSRGPFSNPPPPAQLLDTTPLPGTLEEQMLKDYAARKLGQVCNWNGTTITGMPGTLLWTPPLASKREPRFQLLPTSLDNYAGNWTLDTSIGNTVSFLRVEPAGQDIAFQFDMFAVVHSRLSPQDLLAIDYRFGFLPLTVKWGDWQAKLGYEHTSAHLGDERILHFQSQFFPPQATFIPSFAKDELVLGIGRWVTPKLRLYGQVSYAWLQDVPYPAESKWRFDAGFEWYCPAPTGWSGTPFVAVNYDTRGDQDYIMNLNVQVGWMWRNPFQRLSNVRLFAEHYSGNSPFNQFYHTKEKYYAVGFGCDY